MKSIFVYTPKGEEFAHFSYPDDLTWEPQEGDHVVLARYRSRGDPPKTLESRVEGHVVDRKVVLEETNRGAAPSSYVEALNLYVRPDKVEGEAAETLDRIKHG